MGTEEGGALHLHPRPPATNKVSLGPQGNARAIWAVLDLFVILLKPQACHFPPGSIL